MLARIFRPARSAMQSGRANTKLWTLEFAPAAARDLDPLMGWTETTDTRGQIRLSFDTREEAVEFARRHAIAFEIIPDAERTLIIKAYADNFAFHRKQPWTH
ncbi:MAG: ETC complex I subunit [Caulobacteraceae bacterium]